MSGDDSELEQLKARRLAEMQKNISFQQRPADDADVQEKKPPSSREAVVSKLGYRGLEVLQNAESQFPTETAVVVEKLSELILSGEINEDLDGGKLLLLFRSVGLHVRIDTKINIEKDGKMVSLSDNLRSKYETDGRR